MVVTSIHDDKVAYCNCMEQVKRRILLTRAAARGQLTISDEGAVGEFACLQLRKALELIAFSSLCANRERYAQIKADFALEWRAKRILEKLAALNPGFYPTPVVPHSEGPGRWRFDAVQDGYLTRDDFVFLYNKCSDAVHEWNPFRVDERVLRLERSVLEWADRIERLLSFHYVQLIDQADVLLVQLSYPADGKAHALTAAPLPP